MTWRWLEWSLGEPSTETAPAPPSRLGHGARSSRSSHVQRMVAFVDWQSPFLHTVTIVWPAPSRVTGNRASMRTVSRVAHRARARDPARRPGPDLRSRHSAGTAAQAAVGVVALVGHVAERGRSKGRPSEVDREDETRSPRRRISPPLWRRRPAARPTRAASSPSLRPRACTEAGSRASSPRRSRSRSPPPARRTYRPSFTRF